jgi:hypothetical protein
MRKSTKLIKLAFSKLSTIKGGGTNDGGYVWVG